MIKTDMPELTVSMPAYNTEKYIRDAIESVLAQEGVDFELIVVDDGSMDNTAEVVRSFRDQRVKLLQNGKNMGIAFCHNLVLARSNAPFISHVDSDDLVLPGAFLKMIDSLKNSPNAGQAHCYFFIVNEAGRTTRNFCRAERKYSLGRISPGMDYKKELLVKGTVINHLRTYRREVFESVGMFDVKVKRGIDYDMALRTVDKFEIKLVPEFLYCLRKRKNRITPSFTFGGLIFWWQRVIISSRLLRGNKVRFLRQKQYNVYKMMAISFLKILEPSKMAHFAERLIYDIKSIIRRNFRLKSCPRLLAQKNRS